MSSPDPHRGRSWARSGCSKCKLRRKKCDEGKPRCGHCTRLGLKCDYDSMWKTPATQTNKPRRQKRLHVDKQSCVYTWEPSEPDWSQIRSDPQPEASLEAELCPGLLLYAKPPATLGLALDPASAYYLRYYTAHLSRLLVMVDAPSNPLRDTILPRIVSSPMLLQAVCAVSACHLAQRHGNGAAMVSDGTFGLQNYSQALSSLTRCLAEYSATDRSSVDHIILTAVFLCKYEIIRGSTWEWRHHLTGLTQLVKHPVTTAGLSCEARKYLQSFITYHCQVATITSGKNKGGGRPDAADTFVSAGDGCGDGEIDTYMGFTKSIVELFGRISRLSRIKSSADALFEATSIYEKLQSWSIADEARRMPHRGMPDSNIQCLRSVATAYHSSAVIYFYSMTISSRLSCGEKTVPLSKHAAVMHCLAALRGIPDGMPSESALVLPLFIMGCESEFPAQQTYAIERLRRLETTVGLGNICRARTVVERVRDMAMHARPSGTAEEGPRWSRTTDSLGWDLIVT